MSKDNNLRVVIENLIPVEGRDDGMQRVTERVQIEFPHQANLIRLVRIIEHGIDTFNLASELYAFLPDPISAVSLPKPSKVQYQDLRYVK